MDQAVIKHPKPSEKVRVDVPPALKTVKKGHFEHHKIIFNPLNPDFAPILIEKSDENATFRVLGVFFETIPASG
ncbi:MAG: hypothetical protein EOM12_16055 [Verrucomicrobiae bacterium]|nr:hypothetical protein [Verrucomicrobiae bacterium]